MFGKAFSVMAKFEKRVNVVDIGIVSMKDGTVSHRVEVIGCKPIDTCDSYDSI